MKNLQWIAAAAIAAFCVACDDTSRAVVDPTVHKTVLVSGNETFLQNCVPDPSCLAPLDAAIKDLYERNNRLSEPGQGTAELSHHGEARYEAASASNYNLGRIYLSREMAAAEATKWLRRYVADVMKYQRRGEYSDCAAGQLVRRANWLVEIINTAVAQDFTADQLAAAMAGPYPWDCQLSPITATPSMTNGGLNLAIDDPWGFQTSYHIKMPDGTIRAFTSTAFVDADATEPGHYTYALQQCSTEVGCSAWTSLTVTVPITGPICVHDNRDKLFVPTSGPPKCHKND